MKKTLYYYGLIKPYVSFRKLFITRKIFTLILVFGFLEISAASAYSNNSDELQQLKVTGRVTDNQTGEAMTGVNIVIKGTTVGSITDADGKYSITLPDQNAVLVFSFIGYKIREVPVSRQSVIDIALLPETLGLDEVVVVGYGTQKKTSMTAAVSSVKGEKMAMMPITNVSSSIGGRVSGLIVRQPSGQPGQDETNIYIRGISTTGSASSLLIVDGIPRSYSALDPNTIESITVLKDAAAVAPYGVAGANGVILVTTKKGKTGLPSFKYNSYVGFQNPTVLPDILDGYQYAYMRNVAADIVGLPHPFTEEALQKHKDGSDPDLYPNINVYKEFVERKTIITQHNFEVSGGTEIINYYASAGYLHQDGYWSTNYKDRFNYSLDLGVKATKTTHLSVSIKGREQQNMYPGLEGTNGPAYTWEVMRAALPYQPIVFSNGLYGRTIGPSIYGSGYWKERINQIFSQISVNQELPFIKGLSFKATVAYDTYNYLNTIWYEPRIIWSIEDKTKRPFNFISSVAGTTKPSLEKGLTKNEQLVTQSSLNYSRMFSNKHNIGALILLETKSTNSENLNARRINYELYIDELSMGSSNQADLSNSGLSSRARQLGLVFRFNYDYAAKYLIEFSGRYDGHYYFAPGKRFGFFPAVSLGYRLSEENFMKGISWIDNLKIRTSYGEVGALAGSSFQYLSSYRVNSNASVIGGATQSGISESAEANTNITWERAKKTDVGVEGVFWKGLLSIEADYFYEHRSNMLVTPNIIVPVEYGISISQVNEGEMENRGIDFSIGSNYSVSKDLQVSINGTFTYAKNKLLQVFETPATYDNHNRRQTGRPLNTQFGYVALGYFQVEDFDDKGNLLPGIPVQPWGKVYPGDLRYKDMNDDDKISVDDIAVIGDPTIPSIIYGLSGNVSYKKFELDFLFQGAEMSTLYKANSAAWLFHNNYSAYIENLDYWTPENRDALNPRPTPTPTTNNTQVSGHWVKDASYLRLKSITLAYTIPSVIIQKIRLQNAMVYVAAQNLLTFTKFTNYDPELSVTNANAYPPMKVVSLGINLSF